MGCIHSMIWSSVSAKCECPTHISLKELEVKPRRRTPLDYLGFPQRCCGCCSLRVASFFICFVSFLWAAIEFQCAERAAAGLFPGRGPAYTYCRLVYVLACVLFILVCGGLLLGIIIRKEIPILVFVWYAFVFDCIVVVVTLGATVGGVVSAGAVGARAAVRLVLGLAWCAIYLYLLMVVNSYKLAVWYLTLGFGIK